MIPYLLTLRNFMCYHDPPPLNLEGLHVACLSGENGAGKSALLDAITWALWGKARMSDDELIALGEREMLVELCFVLNDKHYRVARRRQLPKSGRKSAGKSTLDFQVRGADNAWQSLGEATLTETERVIESVLRMNYDTFINASFLLQGRADEFTRKTPGERKQVLADILDLRDYALLEERARTRARELSDQIKGLDGALELLQHEVEKQPLYAQLAAEADQLVARLADELAAAEASQHKADEHVRTLEAQAARSKEQQQRHEALLAEQTSEQAELETLHAALAADEALLEQAAQIDAGLAALREAQAKLADLEALQPHYEALRDKRRTLQDALKDARYQIETERGHAQREAERLHNELGQRPLLRNKLDEHERTLHDLAPLDAHALALREQRAELDAHLSEANTLLLHHAELRAALAQQQAELTRERDEQQRTLKRLHAHLAQAERWQAELAQAEQQQQQAVDLAAALPALRQEVHQLSEQVGERRAICEQIRQQAEHLKERLALLDDDELTACPVCQRALDSDGLTTVRAHYDTELAALRASYKHANEAAKELAQRHQKQQAARDQHEQAYQAVQPAITQAELLRTQLAARATWQHEEAAAQARYDEAQRALDTDAFAPDERATLAQVTTRLAALAPDTHEPPARVPAALTEQRTALNADLAALEQRLARRTELERTAATLRHQLAALDTLADKLPAAQQRADELHALLEQNDYAHEIRAQGRALEARLEALGYTPDEHSATRQRVQALQPWAQQERELALARSRLESNRRTEQRMLALLERREADIAAVATDLAALDERLRALPAARQQARASAEASTSQRTHLGVAQKDAHEKQTLLARAHEATEQHATRQAERQQLATRHGLFQELAEAASKKGVQAMLIETAIPEIEREANRLLGRITNNQMHLAFAMQRSTRRGSTVETLEITIADALGTRTYDAFSGGEALRINFAIRVALSRLLAGRAGASLQTLVIDEGFGALDSEGRERFVEAITSIQDDFQRILVITHLDELKDRFPVRIEIQKHATGSTWALV